MKKILLLAVLWVCFVSLVPGTVHAQDQTQPQASTWNCPRMGQGGMPTEDGWFCPWAKCGMGQGMMHHGKGMGKGMKGQGWKDCPRRADCPYEKGKPVSQEEAKGLLQDYLTAGGNPNLKLGTLTDAKDFYEAQIVTQEGSLVDKIQVNKQTGWFRSGYSKKQTGN